LAAPPSAGRTSITQAVSVAIAVIRATRSSIGRRSMKLSTSTRDISASKHAERERMRFAREHAARAEAETAAWRASVLAGVSRVLVESFMDLRPMLERVARITAIATDTACVIELLPEDGGAAMEPYAIDHADQDIRAELSRVLSAPHLVDDSPWRDLDGVFLKGQPLGDSLSV